MEDQQIIRLFFERSEQAITELSRKYGALCFQIADNILDDPQDAEECVNDAWLGAWNSIPPQRPDPLRAYVCRIVRNLSLKKLRANSALKRSSRFEVSLSELEDCISAIPSTSSLPQVSCPRRSMRFSLPCAGMTGSCSSGGTGSRSRCPRLRMPSVPLKTTYLSGWAEFAGNYIRTWNVRR